MNSILTNTDDDNDGIPTSVELQNHLDPFNSADVNGDLDHEGLNKLLVLSGVGAFITWFNKDIFDRMIVAPLKDIEEIVSLISLGYSIAAISTYG